MSRTYWMAKALRSFGYAGLIVCGCFFLIGFIQSDRETVQSFEETCWGLWLRNGGFVFLFFALGLLCWPVAICLINLFQAREFIDFARRAGNPVRLAELPHSSPVKASEPRGFLADFLLENRLVSVSGWWLRGIFSFLGSVLIGITTFLFGYWGTKKSTIPGGIYGGDADFPIPNSHSLNLDSFLIFGLFLGLLGISIVLAGQARDFYENARLAAETALATGTETRT